MTPSIDETADNRSESDQRDANGGRWQKQMSENAGRAREIASEASRQAAEKAGEIAQPLRRKARDIAEEQKAAGAERLGDVARAVHEAADNIGSQLPSPAADYIHQAASSLERASSKLRESSVEDLVRSVNEFAHRQPVVFFSAAVLTGFALSRFLKSSIGGFQTSSSNRVSRTHSSSTSSYAETGTGSPMYGVPGSGSVAGGVNPSMTGTNMPK
jgi:hypothetical protein